MTDHQSFVGRPVCPGCGSKSATVLQAKALACLELCGAIWEPVGDDLRRAKMADEESRCAGLAHDEQVALEVRDRRQREAMSPEVRAANQRMVDQAAARPAPEPSDIRKTSQLRLPLA